MPHLSSALIKLAAAPYRNSGRFAYHFARGKLSRDPAFAGILRQDLLPKVIRLVDLGSGQSLMASVLAHAPKDWGYELQAYTGIELMPKDTARASEALQSLIPQARFVNGDMCTTALPACNCVLILDVLHYVPIAAQDELLKKIFTTLETGGRLLLRVGDRAGGLGFHFSQWVDAVVTFIRGHQVVPTFTRSLSDWQAALQTVGFQVQSIPMHAGTPFQNILLCAEKSG
ncbi:MAG: hypothetical protein RLZZ502_826 [Pseudomonadota bacterium]|jgi:SAM-dependent methyltransferase